jgi:hypothetical protein
MSDAVFKNHFRFKKESVRRITWLIEDDLKSQNQRGHPLALILQVCLAPGLPGPARPSRPLFSKMAALFQPFTAPKFSSTAPFTAPT